MFWLHLMCRFAIQRHPLSQHLIFVYLRAARSTLRIDWRQEEFLMNGRCFNTNTTNFLENLVRVQHTNPIKESTRKKTKVSFTMTYCSNPTEQSTHSNSITFNHYPTFSFMKTPYIILSVCSFRTHVEDEQKDSIPSFLYGKGDHTAWL